MTNDTFIALRRAMVNKFKLPEPASRDRRAPARWSRLRSGLRERKEKRSFPGNWHLLPPPDLSDDLLETEERRKDRVRLLLDRYGILFRELLQRELPAMSWSGVFRSLRIMELSGEVLAGYFFEGIPGPQFISPQAFRRLQRSAAGGTRLLDQCCRSGFPLRNSAGVSQRDIAPTIVEHPPGLPWDQTDDGVQALREGTDFPCFARGPQPPPVPGAFATSSQPAVPTGETHRHRNHQRRTRSPESLHSRPADCF